jgi:hypothetical protein
MVRKKFAVLMGAFALLTLQMTLGLAADDALDPFGKPKQFKQSKRAVYGVWYEDGAWHLRMTSKDGKGKGKGKGKNDRVTFNGSVKVAGDRLIGEFQGLEKAKRVRNADWILPHVNGRGFDYQFATFGKTDGVTFTVGPNAQSITFKLLFEGIGDPMRILIGRRGAHPAKAEFTLPAHPKQ